MTKTTRLQGANHLEVPRVRLSISGVKSGTNPETLWKRSQSKFWISRFGTVGDPQTLENKTDSFPRLISELCYPQYSWYPFLFWKGPLHGTARAGHEIPNSTGGNPETTGSPNHGFRNTRWCNPRIPGLPHKSTGEGASSLFGGWPGSPENVSWSSRATQDLHAPSPVDFGVIQEFGGCTTQSGSQWYPLFKILETGIGGVKSPKIRGGWKFWIFGVPENPQFGGQKSNLPRTTFGVSSPPLAFGTFWPPLSRSPKISERRRGSRWLPLIDSFP